MKLIAITPKRALSIANTPAIKAGIQRELVNFAQDMVETMAKYPPQEPTPYVRTGNLGRRWRFQPKPPSAVEVFNDAAGAGTRRRRGKRRSRGRTRRRPYAVYVQGPVPGEGAGRRQTAVMRGKGWQNISEESKKVFARHRGRIQRVVVGL